MKLTLELLTGSKEAWLTTVLNNFNSFLQDHADCERKASAMAMSFVAKYPNRIEIIPDLIDTGIEELEHFKQVYEIMLKRNIQLNHKIGEDPYVKPLMGLLRSSKDERFLDRLIVASVVENRGCERFKKVAENIDDKKLADFYKMLWTSEAKHGHLFVKMALIYFPEENVYDRYKYFIEKEAEILENLELRPALH